MKRSRTVAFTLVELLVVITIIVLLLALLAPAMDQAIYQAELAVCATRHHAVASGSLTYAMDFKRRYPYRRLVFELQSWPQSISMGRVRDQATDPSLYDDRPVLQPYFALNKTLNCPLVQPVDIEGSRPDTIALAAYNLWFGWQFRITSGGPSVPGMLRIGDRWLWEDTANNYVLRSSLLSSSHYMEYQGNIRTAHPLKSGGHAPHRLQDSNDNPATQAALLGWWGSRSFTLSEWVSTDLNPGAIDMNASFDDASVSRFRDAHWQIDERMARVCIQSTGDNWPEFWTTVPKQ